MLKAYADGGSRGNPGPAGIGVVIKDEEGNTLAEVSRYLGVATNNQAEYQALIAALETASRRKVERLQVYVDSELVVKQLSGEYRVNNPGLRPLLEKARVLLSQFGEASVAHIPGETNREAHLLAAAAINGSRSGRHGSR